MSASAQRTFQTAQSRVETFLAGGYANDFIPVRRNSKQPYDEEWPQRTYAPADFQPNDNIGLKMGGYADVDLDCSEASNLAPAFLPPAPAIFGHSSKPLSHRLYQPDVPFPSLKFRDPVPDAKGKHGNLLELRCLTK